MAGTIARASFLMNSDLLVSMESGLDGRNNCDLRLRDTLTPLVSMESGLDGRNNQSPFLLRISPGQYVSMESGLDGRNNDKDFADPDEEN